ncbi:vacuolar protein sorting-associated protein VTA1 homolog [Physella acuta]|uniref:vacuolar protein sorting-associated protein VTA1 homolog n=1 Tax=Physella acuta TaxID=109671 RepID=UPI0027DE3375|nr:vacuolar protein sorting-associated protein VTA1 homolog [Physella acuta]
MATPGFAAVPTSLKGVIQKYLRVATEHDKRDPVIAYYCRLYAMQQGMIVDKNSPEARQFLVSLMDFLEKSKIQLKDEEAVHNELCGQAHVENYALKLFLYADNEDRAGNFNKNVIKAFLTSSLLMDVLTNFGELSEEIEKNRKYAKWKALYINKCLQNGETPMAGPMPEENEEGLSFPANQMTFSTDSGLDPAPGAHAPPSTPQDPPRTDYQAPTLHTSPQPAPRSGANQYSNVLPDWTPPPNPAGVKLTAEQFQKGIKYCKFASSAMQYEDAVTAIANLTKALKLLTTGVDDK